MSKNAPTAILGVGVACVAAYLNVNGENTPFLWVGVFFCFMSVLD
jgi:hypothetical protein